MSEHSNHFIKNTDEPSWSSSEVNIWVKNINIIHRCHWKPFTWSLWHRVRLWSQLVLKKDLRLYHKHTALVLREPFGHQRSWSDLRGHMVMVLFLLAGQSHVRPSPWGRWPEGSSTRVSQSLTDSKHMCYYRQLNKQRFSNIFNESHKCGADVKCDPGAQNQS